MQFTPPQLFSLTPPLLYPGSFLSHVLHISFNKRSCLTTCHMPLRHPIKQLSPADRSLFAAWSFLRAGICLLPILKTVVHSRSVIAGARVNGGLHSSGFWCASIVWRLQGNRGSTQKCTSHPRVENQRKWLETNAFFGQEVFLPGDWISLLWSFCEQEKSVYQLMALSPPIMPLEYPYWMMW